VRSLPDLLQLIRWLAGWPGMRQHGLSASFSSHGPEKKEDQRGKLSKEASVGQKHFDDMQNKLDQAVPKPVQTKT
jgi:hypothetical protein